MQIESKRLALRLEADSLESGAVVLEALHEKLAQLVNRRHSMVLEPLDYGYASWHHYLLPPGVAAIAEEGWVARHLDDLALLFESPALAECCRTTVAALFGIEALHVSVAAYPRSDGLIQQLCHQPHDKVETLRRVAGQLTDYRVAHGSYPPPGLGLERRVRPFGPAFDAHPVRA